ncbi:A disintegrin and metalloproteinase with thrombospondin motifs 18-like isoform X2 [Oopsacas minuta]|uniref:A disintegrin and metalloproteinase with thrombospondin motifs 18-like isoform X2 n=1 Tax=Oopsacas minuta TaxID=111878 RepID=A0AAV7JAU8_9METZ|nr:A disintegrin and metalloproteinase with thrombospondin motifs 18-like isoform X2 [Oopsacas minuta]
MNMKIGVLVVFSLFTLSVVNGGGGGVSFNIINEEAPGTRPDPPIPDTIAGNIGRNYFTKLGGRVDITARFVTNGIPDQEVLVRWFYKGDEIEFALNRQAGDTPPPEARPFTTRRSMNFFGDRPLYIDTDINQNGESFSTIYIQNIDPRHVGDYTFEVYSGSASSTASSEVFLGTPPVLIPTPPGITDPVPPNGGNVDLTMSTLTQSCDGIFVVYATFEGDPAPTVVCTNSANSETAESQPNPNEAQTTLKYTLGPFPSGSSVIVDCVATNPHGEASGSITLTSFGTPPELPSGPLPPRDPVCTSASAVVSVLMNQRACGIENMGQITITHTLGEDGIPLAAITWFHRDTSGVVRQIVADSRHSFSRQGLDQVLTIIRPTLADEGDYFASATNCVNTVNTPDTEVRVFRRPVIDPTQPIDPPPGSCQNQAGYVTYNVKESTDEILIGDQPVCITCPATGNPDPTYSWLRDDDTFTPNQGPINQPYLDATGLIFPNQPNCFTCTSTNLVGNDQSTVCIQAGLPLEYRLERGECTRPCGGGVYAYTIVCVEITPDQVAVPVSVDRCISLQLPRPTIPLERCNAIACPPQFLLGAWSSCSSSCEEGTRTRTVRCRQIGANGLQTNVGISVCEDAGLTIPVAIEPCNVINRVRRTGDLNPCPVPENFGFETSPWSACTLTCHLGRRTRTVRCREINLQQLGQYGRVYPDEVCLRLGHERPDDTDICGSGPCKNYGSWLCQAWQPCSRTCGGGGQIREVTCYDSLTESESDNCDLSFKPNPYQSCNEGPCLLTTDCIDSPFYHCYILRSVPRYCDDPRYVSVCCGTCEDIIFRTTTTTPATTTTATEPPTIPVVTSGTTSPPTIPGPN